MTSSRRRLSVRVTAVLAGMGVAAFSVAATRAGADAEQTAPPSPFSAPAPWSVVHRPPAQATSEYGGVRAKVAHGHVDLFRYRDGEIVVRRTAPHVGRITTTYLDDAGDAVVIARGDNQAKALVWRPGTKPGAWTPVIPDVDSFSYWDFYSVRDDAGDVVVFAAADTGDFTTATWTPGGGWQAPVTLSGQGDLGHLQRLDLSPDGRIVGLWTGPGDAPGTTDVTLTSMPAGDAAWSSAQPVLDDAAVSVASAALDARADSAAFALWTDDGIMLGDVDSAGTTHTTSVSQVWTLFYFRADSPASARFVLVNGTKLQLLRFDGEGWQANGATRRSPGRNVVAINQDGDLIFAWDESVGRGRVRVMRWSPGLAPERPVTIKNATHLGVRRAMVLDSGVAWIHCAFGQGRHAFAVSRFAMTP